MAWEESPALGYSSDGANDPALGFPILKIRVFPLLNNELEVVQCEACKEERRKEEPIESHHHHHHLSGLTKLWLSREEL